MPQSNKHRETQTYDAILNGGPPVALLAQTFITPTALFFTRNHTVVPQIDRHAYRLIIDGMVEKPTEWTLDDLMSRFPRKHVTATLQCAGNRRKELIAYRPIDDQLDWGLEAIGNAEWSGISLADVLRETGVQPGAAYVAFEGADNIGGADNPKGYGGSIELSKALSPEMLLADEMNGTALEPIHGFPLRAIVPGYIGARSVKWLRRITVQDVPSDNPFQQDAYKLFPSRVNKENVRLDEGLMLSEMTVNSAIMRPQAGDTIQAGLVTIEGYAITGGHRTIAWVDVSADGGETWQRADLLHEPQPYAWCLWRATFTLSPGKHQLVVRAWDSGANTQPESIASVWNYKGYMNNAWHRIHIEVE